MADKKSLSDLGELTNAKPETPAVEEAVAAEATPAAAESAETAPRPSSEGDGRRGREEAVSDHGVSTQGPQIAAVLREQQLDKQGRVLVPPALHRHAKLGREVVVAGVHDHLEIWDRGAWAAHVATVEGSADDVAERLAQKRV